MKKLLLLSAMFFLLQIAGKANPLKDAIVAYLTSYKQGTANVREITTIKTYSPAEIAIEVQPFLYDSIVENRAAAYRLLYLCSVGIKDNKLLIPFILFFIEGCKDQDSGIAGNCISYLENIPASAFDAESKNALANVFRGKTSHYEKLIRLCGYVNIPDLTYDFQQMLTEKTYPDKRSAWAIHLAMARMGDTGQIANCLRKIKNMPVNDDVVYDLLPDLIYIRQKIAFDYLFTVISSDEKNCHSSNPNSEKAILCGYRMMEMMAPYINDYPLKMGASGDIAVKNYDEALKTLRDWISKHHDYSLKTDIY